MRQLLAELASLARDNVSTAEICDIRQVIDAASEAALAAMGDQSIQILLDAPTGINLPLVRSHIERVFFNLIANAFEAMPGGGKVRIRARKAGTCVLVELEDTGPGIPCCIRDRLFEPFVTSGKRDGLGLGLALARQTVRNHGGDMWTEPAAGARFVIGLPLDQICCGLGRVASSENVGQGHTIIAPTGRTASNAQDKQRQKEAALAESRGRIAGPEAPDTSSRSCGTSTKMEPSTRNIPTTVPSFNLTASPALTTTRCRLP
jgi:hypothetical protein